MCYGVPLFSDGKKALHGKKSNSHSTSAEQLGIREDDYLKFEYHWWDKAIVMDEYDNVGRDIVKHINVKKATDLVTKRVKKYFNTQDKLAKWIKGVPEEWGHLMDPKFVRLAKKVMVIFVKGKVKVFGKKGKFLGEYDQKEWDK